MKTITIQYMPGAVDPATGLDRAGTQEEWGTLDGRLGGVFKRRPDGTWEQHRGTSETPGFPTTDHFRSFLRRELGVDRGRIIKREGWKQA